MKLDPTHLTYAQVEILKEELLRCESFRLIGKQLVFLCELFNQSVVALHKKSQVINQPTQILSGTPNKSQQQPQVAGVKRKKRTSISSVLVPIQENFESFDFPLDHDDYQESLPEIIQRAPSLSSLEVDFPDETESFGADDTGSFTPLSNISRRRSARFSVSGDDMLRGEDFVEADFQFSRSARESEATTRYSLPGYNRDMTLNVPQRIMKPVLTQKTLKSWREKREQERIPDFTRAINFTSFLPIKNVPARSRDTTFNHGHSEEGFEDHPVDDFFSDDNYIENQENIPPRDTPFTENIFMDKTNVSTFHEILQKTQIPGQSINRLFASRQFIQLLKQASQEKIHLSSTNFQVLVK
jgi:hypothetical protein